MNVVVGRSLSYRMGVSSIGVYVEMRHESKPYESTGRLNNVVVGR